MPHRVDIEQYAARVGYRGELKPNLETLQEILHCHTTSIPFENLDVMAGLPIRLDAESLEDKIVKRRRGGYCFELNGLLLEVLLGIGFDATPHSARVRIGQPREVLNPRTHLFVLVRLGDEKWLVDGGVGSLSLTAPLRFDTGIEQETPHDKRRVVHEDGRYFHQFFGPDGWSDIYEFTGEEMPMVDRELGNWWTSTRPDTLFKKSFFCAMARPGGERISLFESEFTHRRGGEVLRTKTVVDDQSLREVLAEFGLEHACELVQLPSASAK